MKAKIILTLFFIAQLLISNGQIVKYSFDENLEGWTTNTIENEGIWELKLNGKANEGIYWNGRDSIHSESGGGAIVCNGDKFITNIPPIGDPDAIYITAIESPFIEVSGATKIYIKFNQYFRNLNSSTRVEVSTDGGNDWIPFPINTDVNQNIETSPADVKYMDITPSQFGDQIKVRFVYEGNYYFWIIDDIEIFKDENPSPQTFPTRYGDSLTVFGKPFEVDSSNWAYVPNELVVQFKSNTTPAEKQLIRDSLGATLKKSCVCDRLELWEFGNPSSDNPSSDGNTIGINEIVKGAKSKSKVDGVDLNRYNFNELQNKIPIPNSPIDSIPNGIVAPVGDVTLVAILDTGIDYEHPSLLNYIYLNTNNDNCLENDPLGWNFVDDNNNVKDDHSHGTHVAGIVAKNFEEQYGDSCEVRIIGYKTHDSYGTSNLFDVACATYQALEDSVNVINDSWGFYGDSSIILSNAVDTIRQYDILIVTASGNDAIDLSINSQYPACYHAPNIVTVGSLNLSIDPNTGVQSFSNSLFSNYDPNCVDILAHGENIISTVPNNMQDSKTGTSMAAPAVTAAAAIAYCSGQENYNWVKENILACADKYTSLQDKILDGNVLNYDISCLTPNENIILENLNDFLVYPNPARDQIFITPLQNLQEAEIQIFDLAGQIIFSKKMVNWNNLSAEEINVNKFSSGVYFIKINSDHYFWSYKMIKI